MLAIKISVIVFSSIKCFYCQIVFSLFNERRAQTKDDKVLTLSSLFCFVRCAPFATSSPPTRRVPLRAERQGLPCTISWILSAYGKMTAIQNTILIQRTPLLSSMIHFLVHYLPFPQPTDQIMS